MLLTGMGVVTPKIMSINWPFHGAVLLGKCSACSQAYDNYDNCPLLSVEPEKWEQYAVGVLVEGDATSAFATPLSLQDESLLMDFSGFCFCRLLLLHKGVVMHAHKEEPFAVLKKSQGGKKLSDLCLHMKKYPKFNLYKCTDEFVSYIRKLM